MDRWSLYNLDLDRDFDLDLDLQCHENYVLGITLVIYCRLWIDGHFMTLTLAFDIDLQRCWRRYELRE